MIRSALPTALDVRVARVLDEPMPDGAVLAVSLVAAGPVASINYRYTLASDGTLFFVRHSGKPGDWQVPFDQPLPANPSATIGKAEVDSLLHKLVAADFFQSALHGDLDSALLSQARLPTDRVARRGQSLVRPHRVNRTQKWIVFDGPTR